MLGDGIWRQATPGDLGTIKIFPSNLENPEASANGTMDQSYRYVTNRHGDATNLSFADRHAEAVDLSDVWSFKWNRNYDTTTDVTGAP